MMITVRLLQEADLPLADRIFRLAFGTFNGLSDPLQHGGDSDKIRSRWLADPAAAYAAEVDGELAGSNFVTHWGRVGFFGPLTVHPDFWDQGVGQQLLPPALALFDAWGCSHTGLYTYSSSPKHLALYQKFGFWPRWLTAIMSKEVRPVRPVGEISLYSLEQASQRAGLLAAAAGLTGAIFAGLDVSREIEALHNQGLGETLLLWDDPGLVAFAAVHSGAGSEAGSGAAYLKFGAARPGLRAGEYFARLLTACEAWAGAQGAKRLIAGMSLARRPAYEQMRARGFHIDMVGVCMHRPNAPGYHRPDAWVIDDWR
jgi:GNAT superfamily N-acetyltransferase